MRFLRRNRGYLIEEMFHIFGIWYLLYVSLTSNGNMLLYVFILNFNQNTNLLNNSISFIALKTYKYKMFCGIEYLFLVRQLFFPYFKKCTKKTVLFLNCTSSSTLPPVRALFTHSCMSLCKYLPLCRLFSLYIIV